MSSPFNPLAHLTPAQPTPNPAPAPASGATPNAANLLPPQASGTPNALNPNPSGSTPLPLLSASPSVPLAGSPGLGALAGLPGISSLPGLSGVVKSPPGGTPWASISAAASAGAGTLSAPAPVALPPGWVPFGASSAGVGEADADNARRALTDVSKLLDRAESIRAEMGVLEKAVFGGGGGVEALPGLQLEYAQTLLALISYSSSYLIGALPVPLSAAAGYVPPSEGDVDMASSTAAAPGAAPPAESSGTPAGTNAPAATGMTPAPPANSHAMPTMTELAGWTEGRAQAQFARREAVRGASRAVLDVLASGR